MKTKRNHDAGDEEIDFTVSNDIFNKSPKELDRDVKQGMKEFHSLLDSLSTLHDKKKLLWKQIYENAILDRRNAYIMFMDLYQKVHSLPTEHAIHGANLAKYLERLNKSNEQLIRLAEILEDASTDTEDGLMNQDNMYERLEKQQMLTRKEAVVGTVDEEKDEEDAEDEEDNVS